MQHGVARLRRGGREGERVVVPRSRCAEQDIAIVVVDLTPRGIEGIDPVREFGRPRNHPVADVQRRGGAAFVVTGKGPEHISQAATRQPTGGESTSGEFRVRRDFSESVAIGIPVDEPAFVFVYRDQVGWTGVSHHGRRIPGVAHFRHERQDDFQRVGNVVGSVLFLDPGPPGAPRAVRGEQIQDGITALGGVGLAGNQQSGGSQSSEGRKAGIVKAPLVGGQRDDFRRAHCIESVRNLATV